MYLRCAEPNTELRRRSRLFAHLSDAEQARLLGLVLHNDLRGRSGGDNDSLVPMLHVEPSHPAANLLQLVARAETHAQLPAGRLALLATEAQHADEQTPQRWLSAWADVLTTIAAECTGPGSVSAAFGACLALAGHVPCPAYAFGRWHLAPGLQADESVVRDLIELACCYAYRLVPAQLTPPPGTLVGRGAYSTSTRHGDVLTKTALNLAAQDFILDQEAALLDRACHHPMAERLPRLHGWDPTTGRLQRSYVPGPTGHDLLVSGDFPAPHLVEDLERAHAVLAKGLRYHGVHLDLHPGNFVWDTDQQLWVLVDAGPVPAIGADYYDLDSFDAYLHQVWLQRLDNMRRTPIRSLDWEPLLPSPLSPKSEPDSLPFPPLEN